MFAIANVGMWVPWHDYTSSRTVRRSLWGWRDVFDSPERIGVRDINNVLRILSGLQIPLDEDGSEDGRRRRCGEYNRNSGLEEPGHVVGSGVGIRCSTSARVAKASEALADHHPNQKRAL